ncbi:MAG: hypothetical protein JOY68_05115, partial [Candidatus Dormibacteraeota bacterium]|nr:hypothetical protein [Candidatus Dormibacteraeota bacterium]
MAAPAPAAITQPRRPFRPALLVAATLGAGCVAQVLMGAFWWLRNLDVVPAYGDTTDYLNLAQTLHVDQYRTILYPAMLRGDELLAALVHVGYVPMLYVAQTVTALVAALWACATAWELAARCVNGMLAVRPAVRRLVITSAALFIVTTPLVLHFAETVLTDSFAASFLVSATTGVVRVAVLRDLRLRTLSVTLVMVAAAELMRPEKLYVLTAVCGVAILVSLIARAPHRVAAAATLVLLAVVPAVAVRQVNIATQTADYGRAPLGVNYILFSRITWPHMTAILPLLPADGRRAVSAQEAAAYDQGINTESVLYDQLVHAAGGSTRLVNETIAAGLRCCWRDVLSGTSYDALQYEGATYSYPIGWLLDGQETGWTASRMARAHPGLTHVYVGVATVVLLLVLTPLFLLWCARSVRRPNGAIVATLVVVAVATLVN